MPESTQPLPNPYVGPRSFRYGEKLYGREQEVPALLDLLIAERIVLLYSPSGAGKTSLVQAALIPELMNEEFDVLPVMRVNKELPPELKGVKGANRYLVSLFLYLEEGLPRDQQTPLTEIPRIKFTDYLNRRQAKTNGGKPLVLIFDQFEEVLTVDPTDRAAKEAFFAQVGTALRDRERWALFVMREEYLAGMDPYLRAIPTRFVNSFRLELLGKEAAARAVQEPASNVSVIFKDSAAKILVDDLSRISVQQADGTMVRQDGLYVEPVQLQVVCSRLWEKEPRKADQTIDEEAIKDLGDVDNALAGYYADKVKAVAAETRVKERLIREWFDRQLITEHGIRGQVLLGPEVSGNLDNRAIWPLVDAHLVRGERVRGATWFELAHDRLIKPVQKDNTEWFRANLSLLQRQAFLWKNQSASVSEALLLKGEDLNDAESWADANPDEIGQAENEFLAACKREREIVDIAKREQRSRRYRWIALSLLLLVAVSIYIIYIDWIETRPWGCLHNLTSGEARLLTGNMISIGRPTPEIQLSNQIDLQMQSISRLHMLISRDRSIFDVRSINGTSVNASFVPYGKTKTIQDGDILVFAGIAPFQFKTIEYPMYQFWPVSIKDSVIISGWGILIDGKSKSVQSLSANQYHLSLDDNNRIIIRERETNDALVTIRRENNGDISIEDKNDGVDLKVTMRVPVNIDGYLNYRLEDYIMPAGQPFPVICRNPSKSLPGLEYKICYHPSQLTYKIKNRPFQIVLIFPNVN